MGTDQKTGRVYIGWGRADITPVKKVLLAGLMSTRVSERIESRISVTALALETRGPGGTSLEQTLMVSCDLVGITFKAELLELLKTRLPKVNPKKITICATHTHTAPAYVRGRYEEPENDPDFMNPDDYRSFLLKQVCQAACTAWTSRAAGGISRGFDHAAVGHCRRAVYYDDTALMYGDTVRDDFRSMEGSEDHSVNLLFTWDRKRNLTGILANLACPSQCDEAERFISSDFWGEVRNQLAERFSPELHLLPQCSAAGDQSPHLLVNKTEEAEMRWRRGLTRKEVIARKIMFALEGAYGSAADFIETELVLSHRARRIALPLRMVTDEEYRAAQEKLAAGAPPGQSGSIGSVIDRYERQHEMRERVVESHLIRLGDAVFATNPFELYLDSGLVIRNRSVALQTFVVQLADATEGYLPTGRAQRRGHYSAAVQSNWVGAAGGRRLADETVEAIAQLFPEPPACENTGIQFNDKE